VLLCRNIYTRNTKSLSQRIYKILGLSTKGFILMLLISGILTFLNNKVEVKKNNKITAPLLITGGSSDYNPR